MKSVLISIKPKYCELIANGKKTVEVRKTKPRIGAPFKCYIYCAKAKNVDDYLWTGNINDVGIFAKASNGKVIGEFVCDEIKEFDEDFDTWARSVAPPESQIDSMGWNKFIDIIHNQACLTDEELDDYFPDEIKASLWHISDLVICCKPKELSEFKRAVECHRGVQKHDCEGCWDCEIKRPPQSWCYVEEVTHEV